MLEKSRNAVFFQWFVCQVSRKVGLLKRRVRSHVLREESKNCTPLWRKAHSEVKMYKTWRVRSTFVSSDVKKMHATVVKSTFGSENAQNMTCLDHFGTFWCWKIARGCGEKHICKSKCTKHEVFGPLWYVLMLKNCTGGCGETHICKSKCAKHDGFGALLSVQMSKNCTPLWRKAHLEVKMFKNCSLRSTFGRSDVPQFYAAVAKSCGEKHIWQCK